MSTCDGGACTSNSSGIQVFEDTLTHAACLTCSGTQAASDQHGAKIVPPLVQQANLQTYPYKELARHCVSPSCPGCLAGTLPPTNWAAACGIQNSAQMLGALHTCIHVNMISTNFVYMWLYRYIYGEEPVCHLQQCPPPVVCSFTQAATRSCTNGTKSL